MAENNVTVLDKDHILVDGKQYVSLGRFYDDRAKISCECKQLYEEIERLREENNHLKALLKDAL